MSYLARSLRCSRNATLLPARRYATPASFHTSSINRAMSEADSHEGDRASKVESHKQDSVQKAKSGNPEWKPELASQGEQATKADKNNMTMEEMQKLGEQQAGTATSGDKPGVFDAEGAIGKQFTEKGAIGGTAEAVGGSFSKDGAIGKQFTTEGSIGGTVQDKMGGKK